MTLCGVFLFQAEDGIRDRVRSRGLGDVYKRQLLVHTSGGEVIDERCHAGASSARVLSSRFSE